MYGGGGGGASIGSILDTGEAGFSEGSSDHLAMMFMHSQNSS